MKKFLTNGNTVRTFLAISTVISIMVLTANSLEVPEMLAQGGALVFTYYFGVKSFNEREDNGK